MNSAFIKLRIGGIGLNLSEITMTLNKEPTMSCKKGDKVVSKYKSEKTHHTEDIWLYDEEILGEENHQERINRFLDEFLHCTAYINKLLKDFEVMIWIAFYPETEQFSFHLDSEILKKITKLGVRLDVEVSYLQAFYDGTYKDRRHTAIGQSNMKE